MIGIRQAGHGEEELVLLGLESGGVGRLFGVGATATASASASATWPVPVAHAA
jgi:hypothetical protein